MEDDLKRNKKMEDDLNKMEDKPINQIQPNWLAVTPLEIDLAPLHQSLIYPI